MEFSFAKWSFDLTKWTHSIKIYEFTALFFFSIKQLTRIKKKKEKEMQQFDKNVVDSKVFGKNINLWHY